jgi:outer membrane protein assembly factor BamA
VKRALVVLVLLQLAPGLVAAQDAETRADALKAEREAKAATLTPPEPSKVEKTLLMLENGRLLERLLSPAEGIYPKIGNVTAGSGLSFGPGYRYAGLFGGAADFSTFGAASFTRYWLLSARLSMPRLAGGRAYLEGGVDRYDFPSETYFGIGPDSRRSDGVTYGLQNLTTVVSGGVRPWSWLTVSGRADWLAPRLSGGLAGRSIENLYNDATAPGLLSQPDFVRTGGSVDFNVRQPRGNPRRGGRAMLLFDNYTDLDTGHYSFRRVEADLQQYIPLFSERRVLALHAFSSTSRADAGNEVPFYLQRTLGGPDDLRGFRRFRFRDTNVLLMQVEYRWEIFTAVDGAIFYDAGTVAPDLRDISLGNLESNYGIGFRFGTINGVFLRLEGAFGSSGGKHFVARFGHAF